MQTILLIGALLSCWVHTSHSTTVMTQPAEGEEGNSTALWDFITLYEQQGDPDRPALEHDVAWLTLNVSTGFALQVWAQTHQCRNCPYVYVTDVPARATTTILVNTTYTTDIKFARAHPGGYQEDICSFTVTFREHGDYWLFMDYETAQQQTPCTLLLANDPTEAEMPILFVGLGLLGLAAFASMAFKIASCLQNSRFFRKSADITDPSQNLDKDSSVDLENGEAVGVEVEQKQKKPRLKSLDTFRGLSLVVMIFVNYGGGGYWFFEHPPWNGLTVADLVFPWFVFIMGTSMTFSFKSMYKREMTARAIVTKVITRSFKLFALGIVLNSSWGPVDLSGLRIPGVLQRFALTYLFISLIHLPFYRKNDSHKDRKWAPIRDVILYLPEWLVHLALLSLFLALTYALPVPGCPTGYTGPGGLSQYGVHENCTGGAARYIDVMVLGENHMFHYPTPQVIYHTKVSYDPEGILGTLTSIFLCFLGIQSGNILSFYQEHKGRIIRWLVWGLITGAIAAILCKCSKDDGWVPLNKNLWSLSFVLTTACFAFVLLTALYVVIDMLGWWGGQPFIFPGMNSIVVYFCHSIFWRVLPINWEVEPVHWKLLLQDVWGASFWVIVAYILYRKKIFVAL
ncbi:heparan-alpha-glucosaminide N-acetyltransferase-like isoform X2 [Littorina saxatilis]|uniref:heparan-alpha-glucosaminide N-acetyltransferase-like isoform X2 n=1 Tax=Littorina saxatilis TaxID=31220 RepID=UPI0038B442CA